MKNRKILVYTSDVDQYNNYNKIQMNQLSPDIQSLLKSTKNLIYNYYRNNQQETIERIQSDWNQNNVIAIDYIKNKPIIPNRLSQMVNDCNFVSLSQISDNIDLSSVFAEVLYDSANHRINFYGQGDLNHQIVLGYIDTTPFVIDGMVDSVTLLNGILTIIFNTDSGKEPITIPLGDIFNVNNYYTKTDIESLLSTKYTKPQTGIPKIHLSQEVQDILNSVGDTSGTVTNIRVDTTIYEPTDGIVDLSTPLSNKVDKETGKGLSSNDYTTADKTKLQNLPTNPVTSISVNGQTSQTPQNGNVDLQINTSVDLDDYYDKDETDEAIATAISQAAIEAIVGNGDFTMTYDQVTDTYYIVRLVPTITVSDESLAFDSTSKVKTITISGHNLKADISIAAPSGWTLSDGTNSGQTLTLAQTNGVVAETQVTLTYGGADASTASGNLTLTAGTASVTVGLNYTQYGGPTITVSDDSLEFEAIGGQTDTDTVTVGLFNITGNVSVNIGSGASSKFSALLSGSTLTITYTPGSINSGTHTDTITLSAVENGDTISKTITVTGTVLEQSLTITPSSLSLQSDNGVDATGTINVKGQNIVGNVTLNVDGSGFSLSDNSLSAADVNSVNGVDVTVTVNIVSGNTAFATISASSGLAQTSIMAEWNKTETDPLENDLIYKNYGYSVAEPTVGQTCDLPITFKVTSVATENSDGTVRIVKENGTEGYHSSGTNYANLKKVIIPLAITIARKTYKVTELGSGAFQGAGLVYAIFDTPSNVGEFKHDVTNMQPFRGAASFRGTGVVDGINTFEYPSSITSTNKISEDTAGTAVKRVIVPNSVAGQLNPVGVGITHIDLGTGITGFYGNYWYNFNLLTDIIIRNPDTVVGINDYVAGQWSAETAPKRTIHVPSSKISDYENNTNWKRVKDADKAEFVAIVE